MGFVQKMMNSLFANPGFTQMIHALGGSVGVATQKLGCGCVLTAEHVPSETHWIFKYNYAECQDRALTLSARLADWIMKRQRHQTEVLNCGCLLIMDFEPEKRLYTFKHDYSKCKNKPFFWAK
jgi:hypothetical protein